MELMVVMLIIATLSASGMHGWQQWQQRQRLWQTARQLSHFLGQLRNDAIWANRNHLLWLKQQGAGWCIGSNLSINTGCVPGKALQFHPLFTEIVVEEITPGLGFYGIHNTARPGHIILKSPAGRWKVILSDWGRIRLCELSAEQLCL